MTTFAFDIETNGFLQELDTVHSLVLGDVESNTIYSFCDGLYETPHDQGFIEDGLRMLMGADMIIGHNILKFDIPAIQKLYPWFEIAPEKTFDTFIVSQVAFPNLADIDMKHIRAGTSALTPVLAGKHKLDAWGKRLGCWKGDYSEQCEAEGIDPWAEWTPDMQRYCEQDVEVTLKLYDVLRKKHIDQRCLTMEHTLGPILSDIEQNGFFFNEEKATALYQALARERTEKAEELRDLFPPWEVKNGKPVTYKRDNKPRGIKAGDVVQKWKTNIFNPNSRDQIADRLITVHGWDPIELTPTGKPKVDETILGDLEYPEAQILARYMMVQKLCGMIMEGDKAWMKYVKDGRIHGTIWQNGTVTGRASHSNPNVGQVPSVNGKGPNAKMKGEFGKSCRECWGQKWQLGCDVSGLELRMLAHYMNDPDYAKIVLEGDVHAANTVAAGLPPEKREFMKTFIYAFLYGAGNKKLGAILGRGATYGGQLRSRFLKGVPALKDLIDKVKETAKKRGYLTALDGRRLHVRSQHSALNTLLQAAGAVVCKYWIVEFAALLKERGYYNTKVKLVAWVHDELQMELSEDLVFWDPEHIPDPKKPDEKGAYRSEVGELCVEAIRRTGEKLNIRLPLTGEYKVGENWKDCH